MEKSTHSKGGASCAPWLTSDSQEERDWRVFEVMDDSMLPRFQQGDIVVAHDLGRNQWRSLKGAACVVLIDGVYSLRWVAAHDRFFILGTGAGAIERSVLRRSILRVLQVDGFLTRANYEVTL